MALFGKKPRATGQAMDLRPNGGLGSADGGSGGGLFGSKKKPSFLPYALAALEDTLSRQMGYQPQGVSRLNDVAAEQRKQAAALAEEQRKRSMGREDKLWEWQNKPSSGEEYTYFEDNAGNRWRQHKGTGAVDANPTFVDTTPKEFVHEGMRFSIPNPFATGKVAGGRDLDGTPATEDGYDYIPGPGGRGSPANWKQSAGGGVSNGTGNFREAFADYAR